MADRPYIYLSIESATAETLVEYAYYLLPSFTTSERKLFRKYYQSKKESSFEMRRGSLLLPATELSLMMLSVGLSFQSYAYIILHICHILITLT
jgi:hypothetical protein